MSILNSTRDRAAAAFLALTVALAGGYAVLEYNEDHSYAKAVWKVQQKNPPNYCYFSVVRAPSEVWDTIGLKIPSGTPALALVKVPFYEAPKCLGGKTSMADSKTVEPLPKQAAETAWATLVSAARTKTPIPEAKAVETVKEEPKEEPKGEVKPDPEADAAAPVEPILVDACATRAMVLPPGLETGADEWVEPCGPESVFEAWLVGHKDAPWRCSCPDAKGIRHPMPCGCWEAACGIPTECKLPAPAGVECGDDPWGGVYGTCTYDLDCVGHLCVARPEPVKADAGETPGAK